MAQQALNHQAAVQPVIDLDDDDDGPAAQTATEITSYDFLVESQTGLPRRFLMLHPVILNEAPEPAPRILRWLVNFLVRSLRDSEKS